MRAFSRLRSALRTLLHKQRVESELDIEIRSYVDAIADEKIESGISPTEARRQALAESGGLEQVKQAVRDQRASAIVESVVCVGPDDADRPAGSSLPALNAARIDLISVLHSE